MKTILAVIGAMLAVGCARPAYVAKSDADVAYMKGGVRQVKETLLDNPGDVKRLPDTLGRFDTYTVVEYNRAGNITRMEAFSGPDSLLTAKEEYVYDTTGGKMERALSHDLGRRGVNTVIYGYDEKGRLVSEVEANGFYRFDVGYDRHGYPKWRSTNSETGKKVVIARYTYDRNGRLKRQRGERRAKYRYHPGGEIAEVRAGRNSKDTYDENGNLVAMAVKVKRRNAKGRVYERFPVTLTAEYEYDARGNWVRRVQMYKGETQNVAVREIDYYEDR